MSCNGLVETSIGTVTAVDKQYTFDEAVGYCRDHGSQLVSVHDTQLMSELASYAGSCGGKHDKWHAGLRLRSGRGSWVDGTLFRSSRYSDLFQYFPRSYTAFTCKVVSFSSRKSGKLYLYENCHEINQSSEFRFFCTGELSAITTTQQPTTTTTTTTQQPTTTTTTTTTIYNIPSDAAGDDDDWLNVITTPPPSHPAVTHTLLRAGNNGTAASPGESPHPAYLLPVLLGILGIIILAFGVFLCWRKRRNARRKREEHEMTDANRTPMLQ